MVKIIFDTVTTSTKINIYVYSYYGPITISLIYPNKYIVW